MLIFRLLLAKLDRWLCAEEVEHDQLGGTIKALEKYAAADKEVKTIERTIAEDSLRNWVKKANTPHIHYPDPCRVCGARGVEGRWSDR